MCNPVKPSPKNRWPSFKRLRFFNIYFKTLQNMERSMGGGRGGVINARLSLCNNTTLKSTVWISAACEGCEHLINQSNRPNQKHNLLGIKQPTDQTKYQGKGMVIGSSAILLLPTRDHSPTHWVSFGSWEQGWWKLDKKKGKEYQKQMCEFTVVFSFSGIKWSKYSIIFPPCKRGKNYAAAQSANYSCITGGYCLHNMWLGSFSADRGRGFWRHSCMYSSYSWLKKSLNLLLSVFDKNIFFKSRLI